MANGPKLLKEKDKKKKALTPSQWQKKCDRRLQEKGHELYPRCEVCGKPSSCLHHFYPKSVSARLRYDFDNLIPICQGCHMRHHQAGDPRIHNTIIAKRGKTWLAGIQRKASELIKVNIAYYMYVWEQLS